MNSYEGCSHYSKLPIVHPQASDNLNHALLIGCSEALHHSSVESLPQPPRQHRPKLAELPIRNRVLHVRHPAPTPNNWTLSDVYG